MLLWPVLHKTQAERDAAGYLRGLPQNRLVGYRRRGEQLLPAPRQTDQPGLQATESRSETP